jgi:glycosyltransferase involved in cell wall biosynthesis
MPDISFSVIIPTHNREKFLNEAIKSALEQSLQPIEIFIVDDVPSLKTEELVNRISKTAKVEIHYLQNIENPGASESRNMAARYVSGEYIAFLDDDDFWSENYLEEASKAISEEEVDIVLTGRSYYYANQKEKIGKIPPDIYQKEEFYLRNPGVACSNFIVKANMFLDVGGYDLLLKGSGDKDIFMRLMKVGCTYHVIKKPLMHKYKGHSDQWTTNPGRILPGVIKFYFKYAREMSFTIHIRMLIKMMKLYIRSIIKR